ncbi:MAG TPA: acetylornithine/succinylornithine family transaminase [Ignavibacteriales bacterium]|nr:acetylornithine/succinylornithine family transaminase [Ignavibacteriales bacterium]HPD66994.1 acetylornithine/succinylornithine family transaminase [Ignavibacteriales bacterium]HRR18846.1 acetylornithine/succinylornithine family transaminase [Ignavibacteriales bacterium]HRT98413.1 acetylornithine/succinylornithine family transaminase [Ignavibacteriales bacterium]
MTQKKSYLLPNYSRYDVNFMYGDGAYLFDNEGKKYVDLLGGIAVNIFGYNDFEIKDAVIKQLNKYNHISNLFNIELQEVIAKKLAHLANLNYVFFSNSGTEANEAAIKFARAWGADKNKYKIIAFNGSFHGRTYGSLSATGQPKFWKNFEPILDGFVFADFNNFSSVENVYDDEVCAIMLEVIQGESGIIVANEEFIENISNFCKEKNILLIVDEIQSGMGRTGKFFAHNHYNIQPDIITLAKGIANGFPLGATICSKEVGDYIKPGMHGSTFGGNPVALAASSVVLNKLKYQVLERNIKLGNEFFEKVNKIKSEKIIEIRGKGLMIGIEFAKDINSKELAKKLLENNFIVGTSGEQIIRILPPYNITFNDVDKFAALLEKLLK